MDATANKFDTLASKIEPIKNKLLGIQASVLALGTVAVYSSAKTESLVDELKGLKGEDFAAPIIEWAGEGKGKAWTSKSQRLMIGADLSEMGYNADEVKQYGTEIEKFFFQKSAMLKRQGVANAEELARTMAAAEKSGNLESIKRLFSSGAISEEKLSRETDRLRTNYEKFAFATDEVVKKQAMHNLMMKELSKTNKDFTGEARTLEQKLDVLGSKFSGLLSGIGDKIEPVVGKVVDALIYVIDVIESIPGHDEILIFLGILISAFAALLTTILALAPVLAFLSGTAGLGAVATAIGGLLGALGSLGGVLATLVGGLAALAGGLASLPLLPVIAAIVIIAGALYLLYTRTTLLQDGFTKLSEIGGKAQAAAQKLWSLVSGGLKGNKTDIQEIGAWVKNFLEGLIPGWLSDLFAQAQSIYREAMRWFDRIMSWWNDFLKKVTEVYDKVKGLLGLGEEQAQITSEMQQYGVNGYGSVNGAKALKVGYHELPTSQWSTPIYDQIKAATGGKTRLVGKEWTDFQQAHPDLAAAMTATGEIQIPMEDLGDYDIPPEALPPEPNTLRDQVKDKALDVQDAITEPPRAAAAAVQQSGDTYVEKSSQTYKEILDKTGSEAIAAHAAYDPVGFYKDLGGKGIDYLGEKKKGLEDWVNGLGKGAEGATIHESGAMIVHQDEEVIPARITSGVGKLASLLGAALDLMNAKSDIESQITAEKIFSSSQSSSREVEGVTIASMPINVNPTININVTKDVDLRNLDLSKMIDWHRLSYEIEKQIKTLFRTQQG